MVPQQTAVGETFKAQMLLELNIVYMIAIAGKAAWNGHGVTRPQLWPLFYHQLAFGSRTSNFLSLFPHLKEKEAEKIVLLILF